MARGSGLSIDSSDPISSRFDNNLLLFNSVIINSFPFNLKNMDSDHSNGHELSIIQFPVAKHDNDDDPGPSDHFPRTVVNEMDFFAMNNNNINCNKEEEDRNHSYADLSTDKKERVVEVNTGLHLLTANTGSDQSTVDDGISPISEDKILAKSTEVETLRAEVERVNRENQQLRDMVNQVTNNYNALQMHFVTMMQQQKHNDDYRSEHSNKEENNNEDDSSKSKQLVSQRGPTVPRQFMNLGLAASCNEPGSLSKLLVRRSRSPTEDNHEGEGTPNKVPRLIESSSKTNGSIDQATEATMRKARVSVRARSEAPMISDGCQWRKYGQKMAKGNPCPRAYYRCTMASGCPVRKQVQRCAEDRTILITTYEGTHSHPLPPTAMMMASATSSAARMLLSGSMPSSDGLINPSNFLAYSRSLFPCSSSSIATISASAPFPTVTLDLTQSPNNGPDGNPLQQLFQRPIQDHSGPPIHPGQLFGQTLYNQSRFSGLQVSGQNSSNNNNPLADTVNALTTDPNFTAALAAAISSLMGNGGTNNGVGVTTSESNGNNTNSHENNTSNGD